MYIIYVIMLHCNKILYRYYYSGEISLSKYQMLYAFVNNPHVEWWAKISQVPNLVITDDVDFWLSCPQDQRVLLWETQNFDCTQQDELSALIPCARSALIFLPEFTDDYWCNQFDCPNVSLFIGGALNWQPQHAQVKFHSYFFFSIMELYQQNPALLNQLVNNNKTKMFDVLLGRKKPHRTLIYNTVDRNCNIVTYFGDTDKSLQDMNPHEFVWPTSVEKPKEKLYWTVSEVLINNTTTNLSFLIPTEIYNQTWYSLIAESRPANTFSFFTEKTIKPMLARRAFVVIAGQHHLKNLRSLGFKTFDGVIDESYDHESDDQLRFHLALQQVHQLSQQNPHDVYQQLHPIIEHNYQHITTFPWLKSMVNDIHNILLKP